MNQQSTVATDPALCDAEVVTRQPARIVGIRDSVEPHALRSYPDRMLPVVAAALHRLGVQSSGPPVCLLRPCEDGTVEMTAGYPVAGSLMIGMPFVVVRLPGGRVVQALHLGPWSTLLSTYDRLAEWLAAHRVLVVPLMWEEYLAGPDGVSNLTAWRTRIVVPLPVNVSLGLPSRLSGLPSQPAGVER